MQNLEELVLLVGTDLNAQSMDIWFWKFSPNAGMLMLIEGAGGSAANGLGGAG